MMYEERIILLHPSQGDIFASDRPPLGLCYIASSLKANGFTNVVGIDLLNTSLPDLYEEAKNADIIGISVTSRLFPSTILLAKELKKVNPNVIIVLGGPHASLNPEECARPDQIDYVIMGEGEESFPRLLELIFTNKSPKDKIIRCKWIKDLDSLPFPDFSIFPTKEYSRMKLFTISNLMTGRSCPNNCTNCQPALRNIAGPYRKRSVANVIEEIRFMKKTYNSYLFNFADSNFTLLKDWVIDFCEEVKKENIRWGCSGCVKDIDYEMLKAMKDSGCLLLSLGVESGSQRVLDDVLKKRFKIEHAINVIRWSNDLKLRTWCFFMIGIPGETKEEMQQTVDLALSIGTNMVQFSVGVPQPDIEWTRTSIEKKWLIPHKLEDIEKPGHYPYNLFGDDPWLGRTSLFQTDRWGPDFIEVMKQRIVNTFEKEGWFRNRGGFAFRDLKKEAQTSFKETFGSEIMLFLNNRDMKHLGIASKLFTEKIKGYT